MTRKKGQGTDKSTSLRLSSAGQRVNELPSWRSMDRPVQTTTAQDSGSPATLSSKAYLSASSGHSSFGGYWHNSHATIAQDSGSPTIPSFKAYLSAPSGTSSFGAHWHNSHEKGSSKKGSSLNGTS